MSEEDRIRFVLALNAQLEDDHEGERWSQLFDEDAAFVPSGSTHVGRPAIKEFVEKFWAEHPERRTKHFCTNSVITLKGEHAEATSDVVVFERLGDSPWQLSDVGRYRDRFIRGGPGWLLTERRIVY